MQIEYLLIGQGLCGTWLSYYLQKENRSFLVIDNNKPDSASRIAAGIINPVTGRRLVTVWMDDEILPFAWHAYNEMSMELTVPVISQNSIIEFFPNLQLQEVFLQRINEGCHYLHSYPDQNQFNKYFNFYYGCGEIKPAYTVHLETLLPAWRQQLRSKNLLLEDDFRNENLKEADNKIHYKDIIADKIIFCDGISSFSLPFFKNLPFAFNKGEALIVEIPNLYEQYVFKKGIALVPIQSEKANLFWTGSTYLWDFDNAEPSEIFLKQTEDSLKKWLKLPFKIIDHKAAIRPATVERRPFVGFHPLHPDIGILNGMGTKGCSLAPFFAKQLTNHLVYGKEILPDADVKRFSGILSR